MIVPLFSPWKVLGLDCQRTRKYSIPRAAHCVLVRFRYVSHWSASDNVVRRVCARMGANLRGRLKDEFGNYAAEIPVEDLRGWFSEQEWQPGTHNRYKSTLSLMFRLAIENKKASTNPARSLKRKREDNGRVRFLNQLAPARTEVEYLKPYADEESRLRAVILADYPAHMPEFEIALHTGMRPSEQYGLIWSRVDLIRKLITIPKSKNGNTRHIPLNSIALAAFQDLFARAPVGRGEVLLICKGSL